MYCFVFLFLSSIADCLKFTIKSEIYLVFLTIIDDMKPKVLHGVVRIEVVMEELDGDKTELVAEQGVQRRHRVFIAAADPFDQSVDLVLDFSFHALRSLFLL